MCPCSNSPCKNGGICEVNGDSHTCYCPHPFTGRNCEIDPCSENPCKNDGICKIVGSTFRCTCKTPYFGLRCERDICYNNPCKNGGICKAGEYGYKCYCSPPFTGKYCEKGPCSGNPCKNGGICKVEGDSHSCFCRSPYSGKSCEINPCSVKPCMNNGTCIIYGESFECRCKKPYYGEICQKDPCFLNPCQNNGTCEIKGKSFTCTCKEPFIGRLCNETPTPSTIPTTEQERTTLVTTSKPDKCGCTNGFCVTTSNGVECVCKPGFGKNPNEYCEACHCGEQFNCTFEKRWFATYKTCICPKGYEEVNGKCVDACSSSPCENGGTCRLTKDSYVCDCPKEFTGKRCQTEKCSAANCKNGKCVTSEKGKTKCVCNPGFAKHPDGNCQACKCGKEFNCTFENHWFGINKRCICPKNYVEERGKCRERCNCENGKCVKSGNEYKCVCNPDHGMYSTGVCK
ncbi:adhesive plaque matrix protein 2-like, partial [Uloborus diversus]|uniref:adhesive plaque matrix protein 2-like n=1 Tax=Uloborus diversus TaxID=327109 RepID=UPI0024099D75